MTAVKKAPYKSAPKSKVVISDKVKPKPRSVWEQKIAADGAAKLERELDLKTLIDPNKATPDNLVEAVLNLHPDTQNEFLRQLLPQLLEQRQVRINEAYKEADEATGQMERFHKLTAGANHSGDACCGSMPSKH